MAAHACALAVAPCLHYAILFLSKSVLTLKVLSEYPFSFPRRRYYYTYDVHSVRDINSKKCQIFDRINFLWPVGVCRQPKTMIIDIWDI
jgi:hypothetical protein